MERKHNRVGYFFIVSILAAFALFSAFQTAYAAPRDLDEIRHAIRVKGGRWVAGETPVSNLPHAEKKKWLGLFEGDELTAEGFDALDPLPEGMETISPATLDWRNVDGTGYVSPVKNQGGCGSCWAFAATAALESQFMLASGGTPVDFSEQILVSCSNAGTCSGGSSVTASSFIRDVGLPGESCFRYTAQNTSCDNACADWRSYTFRIMGWHRPSSTAATASDVKNALVAYGPVVASMYVYNDFYSYRGGVYSYATGSYVGAHAVLVVGYDDANQCFIVKNSWGSGWGESGYFRIAYSEMTGTSRFGYSVIVYDGYGNTPYTDPTPAPSEPQACTYSLSSTSSVNFKPTAASGSVNVYAQGGCTWTAVSGADWITITSGADGSGNGTVVYNVAPNTVTSLRTATLTIAGQTYSVKQQAAKKNAR